MRYSLKEKERWLADCVSVLTSDWKFDHIFINSAQKFTIFIPLDSYRKIDEPNVDKKINFVAMRYSFKEKERWLADCVSVLTFHWIFDHIFRNSAHKCTIFIPLDSYRKIDHPNADKKIYFVAKRYSFKEKERWLADCVSVLTFDWIIDQNFRNSAQKFTIFIPLDLYRKIDDPNVGKKN